jgi:hypothetical protein
MASSQQVVIFVQNVDANARQPIDEAAAHGAFQRIPTPE